MIIQSKAKLHYYHNWAIAYIDPQVGEYYYKLIPKYYYANRQLYPPHITVVRIEPIETIVHSRFWGIYEDEMLEIQYENKINKVGNYFFLNAWSKRIGEIRQELGLTEYRVGYNCYHITIGNTK